MAPCTTLSPRLSNEKIEVKKLLGSMVQEMTVQERARRQVHTRVMQRVEKEACKGFLLIHYVCLDVGAYP